MSDEIEQEGDVLADKRWSIYYDRNEKYDDDLEDVYTELESDKPNHLWIEERLTQELAKENPVAQYALGLWYLEGKHHYKKDLVKGVALLQDAVKKRVPEACLALGRCYELGTGLTVDHRKAFELYILSAIYGEDEAFKEVSRCYENGKGVDKDLRLSEIWQERGENILT
ncbi:tetratricopeptide repeat protein [Kiloniella litopenaei]|uniref:tetratricopeptide repeat protein n=1 Tax=Kiloniella litopenaei TaxID=1549748 RepID=UPI003BA9690D